MMIVAWFWCTILCLLLEMFLLAHVQPEGLSEILTVLGTSLTPGVALYWWQHQQDKPRKG